MKILFIILISGTVCFAIGWLICAILSAGARADECAGCHLSRTMKNGELP